jgi:hypothetical protein
MARTPLPMVQSTAKARVQARGGWRFIIRLPKGTSPILAAWQIKSDLKIVPETGWVPETTWQG